MEILLLLLLVLAAVTVFGHLMWLACAAVLRGAFPTPQQHRLPLGPDRRSGPRDGACAACGARMGDWEASCPRCGLDRSDPLARKLRDLDVASRVVRALHAGGDLDEPTSARLAALFLTRRRALLGEPAPAPAAAHATAEAGETVRVAPLPLPSRPVEVTEEEVLEALPAEPVAAPEAAPALAQPPVPAGLPPSPPPAAIMPEPEPESRPLTGVLSAFMEERNILWGELVGGLLIVGCSIALVLTLWRSLQALPYFPFLLFTALTGTLFAAAEYTLHHWKLHSTSRGLLVISLLLVPLNLLILADPSARGAAPDLPLVDLGVRLAALALFTLLVRAAGRDLIGTDLLPGPIDRRWLLALAVVGTAGCSLFTPHLLDAPAAGELPARFLPLAGLTVACHLLAGLAVLGGFTLYVSGQKRLHATQAHALFAFLGLGTFALLCAFGYLLTRLPQPLDGLPSLAVPLVLAGVPGVAFGLLVTRQLEEGAAPGLRVGGTGTALAGVAVMLLGVGLAWPAPVPLLLTLALSGVVLSLAAVLARLGWVHAAGIPALLLASLIGFHLALGHLPVAEGADAARELARLLVSAQSGAVLVCEAVLLALLGSVLRWLGQDEHALPVDVASLAVALASLLVINAEGPLAPLTAAAVHAGAVAVALLAWRRWRGGALPHAAGAALVAGTLWALYGLCPGKLPWWGLALAGEALLLTCVQVLCSRGAWGSPLALAAGRTGFFVGALGLLFALVSGTFPVEWVHGGTTLTVTLALLVQALYTRRTGWFTTFQAALAGSVLCAVTAFAAPRGWLNDVRILQSSGVGLGALSLAWVAARRLADRSASLSELWQGSWPVLDRWVPGLLVAGQVVLAAVCAWPAVLAEWSPLDPGPWPLLSAGPEGWLLLGMSAALLLARLAGPEKEGEVGARREAVVGLVMLLIAPAFLYASLHVGDKASASALRWSLATCFLAGSVLIWLRGPLDRAGRALRLVGAPAVETANALLALTAAGVVGLTAILTAHGFSGTTLAGPVSGSPFAQMGPLASSIGPLVLVVLGLAGTSLRERLPGYALVAGLLLGVSAVGGYALGVVQAGHVLDGNQLVFACFLGSGILAVAGLAWLATQRRIGAGPLLTLQAWLGLACVLLTSLALVPELIAPQPAELVKASPLTLGVGLTALLLAATAALWHAQQFAPRWRLHVPGMAAIVVGLLAACLARPHDTLGLRLSYHVLSALWSALALSVVAVGTLLPHTIRRWRDAFPPRVVRRWLAGATATLALVAALGAIDPAIYRAAPTGTALAGALLAGAAALWFRRGAFAATSGLLLTGALFLSRLTWSPDEPVTAALTGALGLSTSAALWLALELPALRRGAPWLRWPIAYPRLATGAALGLMAWVTTVALAGDAVQAWRLPVGWLGWVASSVVGFALIVHVLARQTRFALPALYVFGLVVAGQGVHDLAPPAAWLAGALAVALAGLGLLASAACLLWQRLNSSATEGESAFRLPWAVVPEWHWSWLLPAQVIVGGLGLLLAFTTAVGPPQVAGRLLGPDAVVLLVVSAATLARVAPAGWTERLNLLALALVATTLAALAWAVPDPLRRSPWLERNAWVFVALAASGIVGLEALPRWPRGRELALSVAGVGLAVLLVLFAQMMPQFDPVSKRTPLSRPGGAGLALGVIGLIVQALRLAIKVGHDPLALKEERRTLYVYLAEGLLVLLLMHVRLNVPELFLGTLARYWTYAVLLAAFVGVGLGEWFERRGLRVLAVPLARTGVFLPLVPILAFWARPPAALLAFADAHAPGLRPLLGYLEKLPWHFDAHAMVWFLTSALYMLLALSRRSKAWGLVGALAANFGFWALLAHVGVGFLAHPQAWVIPLALILLVAEYLHRDQLSEGTAEALRYLGVSLIYVASTADLFLAGLGSSLWLPVVLAGLCVLGVGAGILLRVRAFLFLGVGFLLVDVLSMIWHAAVDRANTWLWWASGIVLGVAILALFAVFEKRRNDVLKLVEEIRSWD